MSRVLIAPVIVAALGLGAGCGGDDVFPEEEFVTKLVEQGIERPVGECVYSAIEKDRAVMADVVRAGGPDDDITDKTANKMSRILARCLLGANSDS